MHRPDRTLQSYHHHQSSTSPPSLARSQIPCNNHNYGTLIEHHQEEQVSFQSSFQPTSSNRFEKPSENSLKDELSRDHPTPSNSNTHSEQSIPCLAKGQQPTFHYFGTGPHCLWGIFV